MQADAVAAACQDILDAVPLVDRIEVAAAMAVAYRRHHAEIAHELADHAAPHGRRRWSHSAWRPADRVAGVLLFHQLADPRAERQGLVWAVLTRRVVLALRGALLSRPERADVPVWRAPLVTQPRDFVAHYGARLLEPRGTRGFAYLGLERSVAWFEDHCRRHLDDHAAAIWPGVAALASVPFAQEPLAHQAAAAAWDRLCSVFDGRRDCAIRYWLLLRLRLAHELADGGELSWPEAARLCDRLRVGGEVAELDDDDLPPGVTWSQARVALAAEHCDVRELARFWSQATAAVRGEMVA